MAEIPPTRVTAQDGSFNQIPVFEWELSGGVLTKLSPTKIRLAISGSQGPSGPPGASGFTVPLIVDSGGTGRTTIGSAHTVLGVNSSEASLTYYAILASNNATVTKVGTSIFISATSATPIVYAATGNKYMVLDLAADLTEEFRLVQSGNSITVTTAAGLVTINATTGDLTVKQDSIAFPLITGSGGTGLSAVGSAGTILGVNSSGVALEYRLPTSNSGTTFSTAGTSLSFSVNTNVRDKSIGMFYSGNISTTMVGEEARIYIPFNMEVRQVRLACATSPTGANIIVNPLFYNSNLVLVDSMFASGNRPMVLSDTSVGSDNATFAVSTLYTGSWLGMNIDQVGSTVAGSNLTATFVVRTS